MKTITLLLCVISLGMAGFRATARSQSAILTASPAETPPEAAPLPAKRRLNPEAMKRARLIRLKRDLALTDEEEVRIKPVIDRYVEATLAVKKDVDLDTHSKRQKLAELRQQYKIELDQLLTPDQQQKLATTSAQRLARLRAGKTRRAPEAMNPEPASNGGQ